MLSTNKKQNIFSLCGFSNSLNLVNLTEDDINQIKKFVREEGLDHATKMLQKELGCQGDVLLQENQLIDYFGEIYASDPSNFRFVIGDKKLIRLVRDHLIKNQHEKGAKYMNRFMQQITLKTRILHFPLNCRLAYFKNSKHL